MCSIKKIWGKVIRRICFDPKTERERLLADLREDIKEIVCLIQKTSDIRNVPEATGVLRTMQNANLKHLLRVVDVLDRYNIQYWLMFGTLLGTVRHGGFIPWDDDVDIGVLREDHNKLREIFTEEFSKDEQIVIVQSDTLRVMRRDMPAQVDVFPYDTYHLPDFTDGTIGLFWKEYKDQEKVFIKDFSRLRQQKRTILNMSECEVVDEMKRFVARFNGPQSVLVVGAEAGVPVNGMLRKEWVFPLARGEFEHKMFSVPNDSDAVLLSTYGDYMSYPRKFKIHADIADRTNLSSILNMRRYVFDKN